MKLIILTMTGSISGVPGRVGSVTNSASRGVQNKIVASAGNLGRVGAKFGRVGEKFWTRRRDVWTRRREYLDASAVNLVASAKELLPVPKWYRCRCNQIIMNLVESASFLE